ncbi:MAG: CAP domain-containing protein [Patescibacteria group bacterium]|nr:CAP domain-containing protein [Patescibacteria group bacterium]
MPPKKRAKKNIKKQHVAVRATKAVHRHFWDHFVPHEGNGHVPHVLKHRTLFGYSVIILLLKVLVVVTPIMLPSASLYSSAITASNVILLTNQTRANIGLSGLVQNSKLMAAAQAKAMDMLKNQYFAHNSPDGLSPWYFIKSQGYAYERAGENLAVHYTSAEGVHEGWLASPAHRANIVKEEFTEIGVGVVNGDFEGFPSTIVVQFFGRPKGIVEPVPEAVVEPLPEVKTEQVVKAETVVEEIKPEEKMELPSVKSEAVAPAVTVDLSNDVDSDKSEVVVPKTPQVVDTSKLVVVPTEKEGVYEVKVSANQAESVVVQMGSEWVDLDLDEDEELWKGEVAGMASYNKNGESMQIITKDENGEVSAQTAAIIAPDLSTQDFFVFSEAKNKAIKIFGFITLDNLDDKVKKFYVYMMIFLASAIILKVLIKIRVQKYSNIAHACFVIGFAMVMFLM